MKAPRGFDETDPDGRIPEELRAIVLQALEKDPDSRHADARAFRTQIAKLREKYPVTEGDIHRIFEAPTLPTTKIKVMKPGSTQSHLDRNFGVETTPAHVAPTVVEVDRDGAGDSGAMEGATQTARENNRELSGGVDKQVRALLLGAEKLVEAKHGDEARLQLEAAKALAPDHPEIAKIEGMIDAIDTRLKARREAAVAEILKAIEGEAFDDCRRSARGSDQASRQGSLVDRARRQARQRRGRRGRIVRRRSRPSSKRCAS